MILKTQMFYEKDNGLFKFIMNYINMVLRGMEFIYASRAQNWNLHLESCKKLAMDFHSTNRIKYMRMLPYYIGSVYDLQFSDHFTWNSLESGKFSVVKNKLPFVAIGVDHAGEQENKLLKLEGGLTGIANNENDPNRFLLTAPILRQFCDDFYLLNNLTIISNQEKH